MLQLYGTGGDGIPRYATQEADFSAVGLSGEVGEEDKAGGKGAVVHDFIRRSRGR